MNRHRVAWSARGYLILFLALPLLPALFVAAERGAYADAAGVLLVAGLLIIASMCVRIGTRRQRREAFSRYGSPTTHALTWSACVLVAAACFLAKWLVGDGALAMSGVLALTGFAGAYLSYGSLWNQVQPTPGEGYSSREIADELHRAEKLVQRLEASAVALPHGEIRRRLKRVAVKSYRILFSIERDVAELRRSRKLLNVFLPGAVGVAESYVKSKQHERDDESADRFLDILARTEGLIDAQQDSLRDRHAFDLDVQMDVLKTQLDAEDRAG